MRRLTALMLILALLLCGCGDRLPSQTSEPAPSPSVEPSVEPSDEPSVEPSDVPLPNESEEPETPPTPLELTLSGAEVQQGDLLSVAVFDVADTFDYELYLPHTDSTQPMVPRDGEKLYAVAQISVAAEPGDYTMELRRSRNGGEPETIATADYHIEAREFDRQDLVTSSSTQSIYTSDNVSSDNEKMRAARSNSNPQPYFKGLFSCPLPDGWVLTTEFGQQRYVSGKFQSRHAARDMAAPLGTDVYATAPGVVTFAGELIVNGNTIVIDHGAGIFSSYSHLSAIDVEEGDFVDQGALIGLVGSTGYSTGPHLHFGLVASGYYVDPLYPQEHDLLAVLDPLEE